jgi:putative acetyltransferase
MSYKLRRAVVTDAEGLAEVFTDPSVLAGTLQIPYASPLLWRERLSKPDAPVLLLACHGDNIVGSAGLHTNMGTPRRAHVAAVGMGVITAHQRKGVGRQLLAALLDLADNWYGLTRVELSVFTDNAPAIALYTKFGFEHEGTYRAYALRNGELADCHTMARVRDRPTVRVS